MKFKTQIIAGLLMVCFAGSASAAEQADPRYVIKGGEVYDKTTGLTWQRCSVGKQWKKDVGCVGIVKTFTFDQAQQQGKGEWRVPRKEELESLIKHERAYGKQKPTIDEDAFPDAKDAYTYWTSTPVWAVFFAIGEASNHDVRSGAFAVRLARSGQ